MLYQRSSSMCVKHLSIMFNFCLMCSSVCLASSFKQETVLGRSWAHQFTGTSGQWSVFWTAHTDIHSTESLTPRSCHVSFKDLLGFHPRSCQLSWTRHEQQATWFRIWIFESRIRHGRCKTWSLTRAGLIDDSEQDCPPFAGLPNYVQLVAGATLTAVDALRYNISDIAINWDGGRSS